MTDDDARARVRPIRDAARRALRALSRPEPDWETAMDALGEVYETAWETYWEMYWEMRNEAKGEVDG